MNRRDFLQKTVTVGAMSLIRGTAFGESASTPGQKDLKNASQTYVAKPLTPPAHGSIPVAFLISDGAVMIDFAGPWEVFQDAHVAGKMEEAFHLYTVAETAKPVRASGGMKIVPDFTFENAPVPKVIVLAAQNRDGPATLDWIRRSSKTADVTMSVCTGAFLLAKTGLLSGKSATTHHGEYGELSVAYPDIHVVRGARFVDEGNLASSGGLSSGIDLALHVVERYYGREAARVTADNMEYQGLGWTDPKSNVAYAQPPKSTNGKPLCQVCGMDVDLAMDLTSIYNGKKYYFCTPAHKQTFDAAPQKWV